MIQSNSQNQINEEKYTTVAVDVIQRLSDVQKCSFYLH